VANVFDTGFAWLAGKMSAHAASDVTYTRAGESETLEVTVAATEGRTPYDVTEVNGQLTSFVATDFLISPSLLVLAGAAVEPQVGDRIEKADGSEFEVMKPGDTIPCFALVDHGSRFRIHTKRVVEPT
jgi:hypothetical protein